MTIEHLQANWSEAIEVGLPAIDEQHKQLFDLAATFRGEGDQIRVMRTLVTLCDYANTHLREEEALLRAIAYPEFAEHKRDHLRFRQMLRQLLEDSRNMTLDQIADRVEALINGWFYQHILTVDAYYVPAVKAYEARQQSSLAEQLLASAERSLRPLSVVLGGESPAFGMPSDAHY